MRNLIALPGDPDLDVDVDGLTITAVVSLNDSREVMIQLVDGFGRFFDQASGQMVDFPPADPDRRVDRVGIKARMPLMPSEMWLRFIQHLERWRDESRPLRMVCAPGRMTLLIGGKGDLLPIPRAADPLDAPGPDAT